MQRTMSSEELSKYVSKLKEPSDTFKLFIDHYVLGDIWIRSRGDEDTSVWSKLKGNELEIAKQIILDELKIIPDESYLRAVSIFKDDRAIPILELLIESLSHSDQKLLAAKSLYDLTGYQDYIPMLETICNNRENDMLYSYLKYSIGQFVSGLEEADKVRIMKAFE